MIKLLPGIVPELDHRNLRGLVKHQLYLGRLVLWQAVSQKCTRAENFWGRIRSWPAAGNMVPASLIFSKQEIETDWSTADCEEMEGDQTNHTPPRHPAETHPQEKHGDNQLLKTKTSRRTTDQRQPTYQERLKIWRHLKGYVLSQQRHLGLEKNKIS